MLLMFNSQFKNSKVFFFYIGEAILMYLTNKFVRNVPLMVLPIIMRSIQTILLYFSYFKTSNVHVTRHGIKSNQN